MASIHWTSINSSSLFSIMTRAMRWLLWSIYLPGLLTQAEPASLDAAVQKIATRSNHSLDISQCHGEPIFRNQGYLANWGLIPLDKLLGYKLVSIKESNIGLTARLSLIGSPCNAFGDDISDLTVQVTYETDTR